jgi:hypothetical protein
VFSATERHSAGANATLRLGRGFSVGAGYHALFEPDDEGESADQLGHEADALVQWTRRETLAGIEGFFLDAFDNGYVGGRIFGRQGFGRAFAAADVLYHSFREDVNGESSAVSGTLSAGYELLKGLSAVVSGRAGITPFLEETFEVMAKLAYGQTYVKREVR